MEPILTVQVDVSVADIRNGYRNSCFCCPIAYAFRRALPKGASAQVHNGYAWLGFGRKSRREDICINLPESVRDFMKNFDRYEDVQAFTFGIEIPSRLLRLHQHRSQPMTTNPIAAAVAARDAWLARINRWLPADQQLDESDVAEVAEEASPL